MISRILVPLDGSRRSERALPYATQMAQLTGGTLILVHDETVGLRNESEPPTAEPVSRLTELVRMLVQLHVPARMRIVHGSAADAILRAANEEDADLIVMSTHGRGGLGRWLYGSVADTVLRDANRPVLLVTAACERTWATDRPFRMLVPLDGSPLAETALDVAGGLADALKTELLLLRVVEPADGFAALGTAYLPTASPGVLDEATIYLDGISTSPSMAGRAVTGRVETGDPAAKIAAVARYEEIDLVVMATHASGGLARLTMGSVASAILHVASVPLLLVPPGMARRSSPGTARATTGKRPMMVV